MDATTSSHTKSESLSEAISTQKEQGKPIVVSLSNDLVYLLLDQLYQSPIKAVEELIVNSYDADAEHCCVYVPLPSEIEINHAVIFDDGVGMSYQGLVDLWHIGRSEKRREAIQKLRNRKQIGKFGIGKLAARTIADKLTYITKAEGKTLSVTINFNDFRNLDETADDSSSPNHNLSKPIELIVREIDNWDKFLADTPLNEMLAKVFQNESKIEWLNKSDHWTIAILEDITDKGRNIRHDTLTWVLSSAMPLSSGFNLYLNGKYIESSKEGFEKVVEFEVKELPEKRLQDLNESTKDNWLIKGDKLFSDYYKSGIEGKVIVTKNSLYGQKSDDLARSHGFFVRVRGRVVNYTEPLFGLKPLTYEVFNRLNIDIQADDLDEYLKASREAVEESKPVEIFRELLRALYNEALVRFNKATTLDDKNKPKKEGEKPEIESRLVEEQIADTLINNNDSRIGPEADESWFYLDIPKEISLSDLASELYNSPRRKYKYDFNRKAVTDRMAKLDLATNTFWVNEAHEFVMEYSSQGSTATRILEDVITAEVLLEVYLRNCQIPLESIAEVLERRDQLFRSLAKDGSYSFKTIAARLRNSSADQYELEISLVVAMRALGFNATHISNAKEPDGIAIFTEYGVGEKKITLEAKSSKKIPELSQLDFAGLRSHMDNPKYLADGCLLLAPSYRGTGDEESEVSLRSQTNKISCWTVELLAKFVELADKRHFNARNILDIVLSKYDPSSVEEAVNKLTEEPGYTRPELYQTILDTMKDLHESAPKTTRHFQQIYGLVTIKYKGIEEKEVRSAIEQLAAASKNTIIIKDDNVTTFADLSEIERRVADLVQRPVQSRRISSFKENELK